MDVLPDTLQAKIRMRQGYPRPDFSVTPYEPMCNT